MDTAALPSVLVSSLVVVFVVVIHPDRSTLKVSAGAIKVIVAKVLQLSLPLHTISLLSEPKRISLVNV